MSEKVEGVVYPICVHCGLVKNPTNGQWEKIGLPKEAKVTYTACPRCYKNED
jgi:hypothetical protein